MDKCSLCKYDKVTEDYEHCPKCENGSEFVRITNADRIRSMTDEELAEFLKEYFSCEYGCPAHKTACICDCNESIIKWLQKECEV